jgi:hypothetical protein
MKELIARWRAEAASLFAQDSNLDHFGARKLTGCADDLEQAWHDHAHDGAWETDGTCKICLKEMLEQDHEESVWDDTWTVNQTK